MDDSFPDAFFEPSEGHLLSSLQWTSVAVAGVYSQEATQSSMIEVSRLRGNIRLAMTHAGIWFRSPEQFNDAWLIA